MARSAAMACADAPSHSRGPVNIRVRVRISFTTGAVQLAVTKVTFHLPPTATHLLGEWTLPSRALVLCSSDVPDEVKRR